MYIHKNKFLLFCNKPKNRMQLSAVCFNFVQHKNEQTLHTLKNTGLKKIFGLTEHIWCLFYPVNWVVYLKHHKGFDLNGLIHFYYRPNTIYF